MQLQAFGNEKARQETPCFLVSNDVIRVSNICL